MKTKYDLDLPVTFPYRVDTTSPSTLWVYLRQLVSGLHGPTRLDPVFAVTATPWPVDGELIPVVFHLWLSADSFLRLQDLNGCNSGEWDRNVEAGREPLVTA